MNKYRPGGRCGGSGASERSVSEGGLGKSLSAMMAAREQQDAMWSSASQSQAPQGRGQVVAQGGQLVAQGGQLVAQGAQRAQATRKNDMNTILQGDIGDD
jgi:hypothetical protein